MTKEFEQAFGCSWARETPSAIFMRAYAMPRKEAQFFTEYLCHVCGKRPGKIGFSGSSK
jgi:hypothetical protein